MVGYDVEPYHQETLRVIQASALTLRRDPSTPVRPLLIPRRIPARTVELPDSGPWVSDQKLLAALDAASPLAEAPRFQIRPPKAVKEAELVVPASGRGMVTGFDSTHWVGVRREDNTAANLRMTVMVPPSSAQLGAPILSPDTVMKQLLEVNQRRCHSVVQSNVEKGTVNGLTALRAHWSGDWIPSGKAHGFVYVIEKDRTVIAAASTELEPHHATDLRIAEAAALTLRGP
jgi:hypothetical protein